MAHVYLFTKLAKTKICISNYLVIDFLQTSASMISVCFTPQGFEAVVGEDSIESVSPMGSFVTITIVPNLQKFPLIKMQKKQHLWFKPSIIFYGSIKYQTYLINVFFYTKR